MKVYKKILEILDGSYLPGSGLLPVIFNGKAEPKLIGHAPGDQPEHVDELMLNHGMKATYISLATVRDDDRPFFICYG